jgi:hypothetical protein
MLPNAIFNQALGGIEQLIETLGTPASWRQTKAPNLMANMTIGVRRTSKNDQEIINAYGQGVILGTAKASDFPVPPEKFDTFVVEGQTLTVTSANPVALNNKIIMYKLIMKGK